MITVTKHKKLKIDTLSRDRTIPATTTTDVHRRKEGGKAIVKSEFTQRGILQGKARISRDKAVTDVNIQVKNCFYTESCL